MFYSTLRRVPVYSGLHREVPCTISAGTFVKHPKTRDIRTDAEAKQATVVSNSPASLDESLRTLTLSVRDPVEYLDGRRISRRPSEPRWLAAHSLPGQKLKVVVDCDCGDAFNAEPGSLLTVSNVFGSGFVNPVKQDVTLTAALEAERPILLFVSGGQGIAAARASLTWDPVQAAATQRPVILVYIAGSPQSAAFMPEWDQWRSSGAIVLPVYIQQGLGSSMERTSFDRQAIRDSDASVDDVHDCALLPAQDRVMLHLKELLAADGKVAAMLGNSVKETVVLFAGLEPWQSKTLLKCLSTRGIHSERMLYI